MFKKLKFYHCGLLLLCFIFVPDYVCGQDLGSSSGLFNSPKSKTNSKAAPKKTAPKPKSPAATAKKSETKSTVKPAPKSKPATVAAQNAPKSGALKTAAKTNPPNKTAGKVQSASNQTAAPTQNNVVIKVGQPVAPKAGSSNADLPKPELEELFEKSIEEGNTARDDRDYPKAEAAYLRAQSLKTKDSRAVYGLGNLYSDQQRWEEAEAAYRLAIGFEPNSADAYVALSFVLTQPIYGMDLGGRYAEAEKLARRAIALDQKNAVAFDQLGVALELSGEVGDETRNSYRKAIQLDPNFALAYAHLGRLLRRIGLINESSAAYRTAVQMSADVPTMILVADVMQSQQRYLDSEELLRRALRQDSKNPTALLLLGRALTIRGSFDEAEKVLKKCAEISPKSFVAYSLLGSLFTRREKYDDAEKYLLKAMKIISISEKKRLAQDFEAVGDGYFKIGKNSDAARLYREAVALDREKLSLSQKLAKIN